MDAILILAIVLFAIGYLAISLEHKINTNKSAIALALGGMLWFIAAASNRLNGGELEEHLAETSHEIFTLVAFLLAAMTLVEILVHYQFFDLIRIRLNQLNLKDRKQFIIIGILTFFISAILDNLTVTIVMVQIARRFFKDTNLIIAAAGIVILANAGGAWSPIGDVTTIMLWINEKFGAGEIIRETILPSLVMGGIPLWMLSSQIKDDSKDTGEELDLEFSASERIVIGLALASFALPLIMHLMGLEPYMGLLLGLGIVWLYIEFAKVRDARSTHLEANIDKLLQKVDIASLNFFIGILLSVSALSALGVLEHASLFIFGEDQSFIRVVIGNIILGPLSAIVDNVPLTAIAIDIIKLQDPAVWTLLALAVGTGGSLLVIGSAAGVIAMGMVKQLTFNKYLKIATFPALVGYVLGILTWVTQYYLW